MSLAISTLKFFIIFLEYEKRYPGSRKVTHYRKSISEQYAPYIHTDGLLERVTRYADYECEDPKDIRERYEFRSDLLYYSQKSIQDHAVHERFRRGREDALKGKAFWDHCIMNHCFLLVLIQIALFFSHPHNPKPCQIFIMRLFAWVFLNE